MENAKHFRDQIAAGTPVLGTCVTFFDPTVTEALTRVLDFVWIDSEHNPMSLERIQGHILATKGTRTAPLVRVAANDPVLIKPVLDVGAAGVIVPLVKSAEDVRLAVAACRYPPDGIRGYGPRRPADYGRLGGPDYLRLANESIITVVQIEQREAFDDLDELLAVPGLTSIMVGPNDLSASLGFAGQPTHPEVIRAIDTIIAKAKAAKVPAGIAVGPDPEALAGWLDKGFAWVAMGADFSLLLRSTSQLTTQLRSRPARAPER
jgi:2-keto-3-deoxy-L-rhamnonate aldolase RhmA